MRHQLSEGLRKNDLIHLMDNKIHFDEYDSKMGDNDEVITASFKVKQRMPAQDLVSFVENGYNWVLDADVSPGEISDGEFLVFVEMARSSDIYNQLRELLEDISHLTDVESNNWKFKWYRQKDYYPLDEDHINSILPTSPEKYKSYIQEFESINKEQDSINDEINQIKKLSGIG